MFVSMDKFNRDGLAALVAVAGPLNAAKVSLFTAGPTLNGTQVPGDFTEADFDGYAAATPAWGTPYTDPNGLAFVDAFIAIPQTGNTTPNTVLGYYVTNADGTGVLYAEYFANPILMSGLGSMAEFVLRFDMSRTPGGSCQQVP